MRNGAAFPEESIARNRQEANEKISGDQFSCRRLNEAHAEEACRHKKKQASAEAPARFLVAEPG
jgi:hypothetical protein